MQDAEIVPVRSAGIAAGLGDRGTAEIAGVIFQRVVRRRAVLYGCAPARNMRSFPLSFMESLDSF
ncbi:MAG: hypothetical protein ACR652_14710 [Methylocystis sp.]|uniref:hypothetical protein n=1 Tax=Methylocystis sp. TaxID=1911079 RepID=UPI003DA426F6